MANRCALLALSAPDAPTVYDAPEGVVGGSYGIPWFWLTLFATEDLVVWPPSDGGWGEEYTALIADKEVAAARSQSRVRPAREIWPAQIDTLAATWFEFLGQLDAAWLAVWTEDLAAMTDDASWRASLIGLLTAIDHPGDERFRNVLAQSWFEVGPRHHSESALSSASGLAVAACGYACSVDLPWNPLHP